MKMTLSGKLGGKELRTSQKGNAYAALMILQGIETLTCMCDDSIFTQYATFEEFQDYNFTLEYSVRWKSWKIVGVELAS
jgi:hypothetical protein